MSGLRRVDTASNRPLLAALGAGASIPSLLGHELVRRDGTVVAVADAREADWLDLLAQLDEEPLGPEPLDVLLGGRA